MHFEMCFDWRVLTAQRISVHKLPCTDHVILIKIFIYIPLLFSVLAIFCFILVQTNTVKLWFLITVCSDKLFGYQISFLYKNFWNYNLLEGGSYQFTPCLYLFQTILYRIVRYKNTRVLYINCKWYWFNNILLKNNKKPYSYFIGKILSNLGLMKETPFCLKFHIAKLTHHLYIEKWLKSISTEITISLVCIFCIPT